MFKIKSLKHFITINFLFFIAIFYLNIFIGQKYISPFSLNSNDLYIIQKIRIPLFLSAIIVGAVFSSSGLMLQMIFKNNLATPYTLGVSSGAVFFIILGNFINNTSSIYFSFLTSIIGSISVLLFLFAFVNPKKLMFNTILLVGISVNIFFSSAMMLIQYFSDKAQLYSLTHWLIGSLEITQYINFLPSLLLFILLSIYVVKNSAELDLMSINTNLAYDRGIDVNKIGKTIIFIQALMLGSLIPFTGPVSFVGLIIPNTVRIIFKNFNIKKLFFSSVLLGINFMSFAHFLTMTIKQGEIIPIGIITSITGAFFLIFSILKKEEY